jgi:hypothetical protein
VVIVQTVVDLRHRPGLWVVAGLTILLAASRFYFGPGELERTEIYTDFAHVWTGWILGVWFGAWWIGGHRWNNSYLVLFALLAFAEIAVQASRFL